MRHTSSMFTKNGLIFVSSSLDNVLRVISLSIGPGNIELISMPLSRKVILDAFTKPLMALFETQ